MVSYWSSYKPTLQSMMLDSEAERLTIEEREEILSYLPHFVNKKVLELGAGIGRYTGYLAGKAESVTAVDFIQEFVNKNAEINGHFGNIEFVQSDVTQLILPSQSYDVIFTNWLLMYLDDDEVVTLVSKMLDWLKDDGYLFVRESCFHPSGAGVNRPSVNPTFYRSPTSYIQMLQTKVEENQKKSCFQLIKANSLRTYVKYKNNPNQLCFLLHKTDLSELAEGTCLNFQAFLDENQYTRQNILRYERIFGLTYVSTGGKTTTREFCNKLDLTDGESVLDVGCGIGGSAFYMAKTYNVHVHAVDLSSNMISIALEKQLKELTTNKVYFEISDITKQNYPAESFDVIYSRDTILHIENKEILFSNFMKWLKPGGRLLVSDYCQGSRDNSREFRDYVTNRRYFLSTIEEYGQLLNTVGFSNVRCEDHTSQFVNILREELAEFSRDETFLKEFSQVDFDAIVDGWNAKIRHCLGGDQKWGLFTASKC